MANLAALVSSDSRKPLQRLRRAQLHKIADRANISYPKGAPATDMVEILSRHQISGLEQNYNDITHFQPFTQQDENGSTHVEVYPVQPKHQTADKVIDYDSAIEERAKTAAPAPPEDAVLVADRDPEIDAELERLREQNTELAEKNAELSSVIADRLDALEQKTAGIDFPLDKLLPWQLMHMAKARGIDYKGLSKEEIIELLEA
jgi:hypothetical protein